MIPLKLLHIYRHILPSKLFLRLGTRNTSTFLHRPIGRIPNKLYNELTKFSHSPIKIQPRMEYLPIGSKITHFNVNTNIVRKKSPQKLELMLEPIVFHLICIINDLPESQKYFERLYEFLGEGPDTYKDAQYLSQVTHTSIENLIIPLKCYYIVSQKLKRQYDIQELVSWLESIKSQTIVESYNSVKKPPTFILFDIMLRNPQFREDFLLQMSIWRENMRKFALLRIGLISILKHVLDNLIYYSIMFEPDCLQIIIQESFKFFKSSRTGINVELGDQVINELIWNLALYSSKYRDIDPTVIANAQELLISYLARIDYLSFKAYMGITIVIARVSHTKGEKLFHIAEKKFAQQAKSLKDLIAYNITRICLCNAPDHLLDIFSTANRKFKNSSKIWLFFIRRLNQFGMLDETRAKQIFKELVNSKVKLTSDLVTEVVRNIDDLVVLRDLVTQVDSKTSKLFIKKYIQLASTHEGSLPKFPWNEDILNVIPATSVERVGLILETYAKNNRSNVFPTYKKELMDKGLSPNKSCLGALLKVASLDGKLIAWNGFTAPEIAVIEFQKHVKTNHTGLIPNEWLWGLYIQLLIRYDYVSELSKIMKWWEDLRFEPSKDLLLTLLGSLPKEFAERHIKHHEKAHLKRDWPWPSIDEYNIYIVNRK